MSISLTTIFAITQEAHLRHIQISAILIPKAINKGFIWGPTVGGPILAGILGRQQWKSYFFIYLFGAAVEKARVFYVKISFPYAYIQKNVSYN